MDVNRTEQDRYDAGAWKEAGKLTARTLKFCIAFLLLGVSLFLIRWHLLSCAGDISMMRGRYEEAAGRYETASEYIDVSDKLTEARYYRALGIMEAGEYEQAAEEFSDLDGYKDSAGMYKECRYQYASGLAGSGNDIEALGILRSLGDYKDAEELALAAAKEIFGDDYTEGDEDLSSVSEEKLANRAKINDYRSNMTEGRIAVGFYHTVALKSDGTVVAAGDNSYGQCDITGWTGVKAVDAGAYFTVGLKTDGTVLFTGLDDYGESGAAEWTGVKAISAGYNMVAGLLEDGTVVTAGRGDHSESATWQRIAGIRSAGDYVTALSEKGYAMSEHASVVDEKYSNLIDIAAADAYTVGLTADGELVTNSGMDLSGWTGIADIECGPNGFIAVQADGETRAYFFRPECAVDTSGWKDVREIAVGGTHYAAILQDGTVIAAGRNNCGQCDVSGWRLDG